jgi:hypothetical protein
VTTVTFMFAGKKLPSIKNENRNVASGFSSDNSGDKHIKSRPGTEALSVADILCKSG